ncbi:MAG: hypothetical protein J0J05_08825 [Microbacterium sp.]|uniref:hypothetical protein n=1 Tax=Microbacterium sp. TaxID=51671 RepID=UPI001AD2F39C|nr:hypothetical protein [Microbacterium sp.]MBN9154073.1 hypothetical protein [Microbacterium sp.]
MKKSTKVVVGGMLAAALLLPAANAFATSSYTGFNVNMSALQQGVLAAHQTKTSAAAAGSIKVATIGGGYHLNARQCRLDHASGPGSTPYVVSCGTEVTYIAAGATKSLPSGSRVAAGKTAYLELHNQTWTVVRVQATGSWRAN